MFIENCFRLPLVGPIGSSGTAVLIALSVIGFVHFINTIIKNEKEESMETITSLFFIAISSILETIWAIGTSVLGAAVVT